MTSSTDLAIPQEPRASITAEMADVEKVNKDEITRQNSISSEHGHSKVAGSAHVKPSPDSTSPDEKDTALQATNTTRSEPQKDYSIFTTWQKRFIVLAATLGAFFSPFTAQIYFPALTSIAKDLHVSNSKVNLTITTYMILQAIAPAFIGGFSDTAGRRPAYIICFVVYIAADIALALQNNYVALLVLRMVQSGGSSGTVALANAVVADVVTSAERGKYIGLTSLTVILAPSLGPILGGILSQYAGWHWIFWFLAILATCCFIPMLLFMPETCRLIVDDGSVPPPKWNRSLLNHINEKKRITKGLGPPDYAMRDELARKRGKLRFPNPLTTLVVATEKECFLILFYAGMVYAGFYAVISGLPSQLQEIYGYDDLKVGLMFLPLSGGCIVAAFTQGRLIDGSFEREAKKIGMPISKKKQQDLRNFPIEKARLQVGVPMLILTTISTIIYGWLLHFRVNIAGICVMLAVQGFGLIAATQCISVLIIDINRGQAGTATAAYNLIRCLLGAGATALILPMTNKLGLGWSYTLIGLIYVVLSPILLVVVKYGPGWREARRVKLEKEEAAKREKEDAKREAGEVV